MSRIVLELTPKIFDTETLKPLIDLISPQVLIPNLRAIINLYISTTSNFVNILHC